MTSTEKRLEVVRLLKSREKKNKYTQARPCYFLGKPEGANPGYADCSGTMQTVMKRAAEIDIGGNTSAQIDRRGRGKVVEMASSGQLVPTEEKLKPGDLIYYKGNAAHSLSVGHVEMYIGGGRLMGHGSGTGPTSKNLTTYSKSRKGAKSYLCAIRWIPDDEENAFVVVTGGTVYVRRGPGTGYKALGVVKSGDRFAFEGEEKNGFYRLTYKGESAYISMKYAEVC